MSGEELAVKVENLVKRFGKVEALKGVSFEVQRGEIFGLVGPNGAGKTTTLRIIATVLQPTSGNVSVLGYDVVKEPEKVRKLISYVPEESGVYNNLTGWDYLRFFANLYAEDEREAEEFVEFGAKIAKLGDRLNDRLKTYSKGMVRRLVLARALMVKPKLAILDEPTSGVDVAAAVYIRNLIKAFRDTYGTTFIISSHNMFEVEYLCDRIAFINEGRIVAIGTPKELKEKFNASNLEEAFIKALGKEGEEWATAYVR